MQNRPSNKMLLVLLVLYLRTSSALLVSTDNRVSTRNITCKHDVPFMTTFLINCEACLITSRNYAIETTLSLTGSGPAGLSYTCLPVNEVEVYHENLIRECYNFPRDTLNGYDDYCIASPFSYVRGSYRACICITEQCNFDYTQCIRQINPLWNQKSPLFSNTIAELTNQVKCYRPYEDYKQQPYSTLTPLCLDHDDVCKDYILNHGVLCAISVDRTNQITRQTLIPSIYSAYLIKYKTQFCNSYTLTSNSISFSQCRLDDTVCMCTFNECDRDLETCRANKGIRNTYYLVSVLFVFVLDVYI